MPSGRDTTLLTVHSRWQQARRQAEPALLTVGLLASYTIDPLVPHLGVGLIAAGLPPTVRVGPYNQIVQQCLGDTSETAASRPDVLIVAPRFEEVWSGSTRRVTEDMLRSADVAVAAAGRWRCCLVYVLPAIPQSRPSGVGDAGSRDGVVAVATTVREALRARLAGLPNVYLADAEEAVRAVGARRAHHPALLRYAKVPYTEELFACLAAQLVGLLRVRYGLGCRALVLDADSLFGADPDPAERAAVADTLRGRLAELRHNGVRLGVRGGGDPDTVWETLAGEVPELLCDLLDGWVVDDRPIVEQLRALAAEAEVPVDRTVLLTTDPALATQVRGGPSAVLLSGEPGAWAEELRVAGLFDRAPAGVRGQPAGVDGQPDSAAPVAAAAAPLSVAEYIASLNVTVTCRPVAPNEVAAVAELVERAKDFDFGFRPDAATVAARRDELIAVTVRDRLGDYGIGAAVALNVSAGTVTVDLFSVSCPVLGKGVEEAVLREIVERAAASGCDTVRLRYRRTPGNRAAQRFLTEHAARTWRAASGRDVIVRAEPDSEPTTDRQPHPGPTADVPAGELR